MRFNGLYYSIKKFIDKKYGFWIFYTIVFIIFFAFTFGYMLWNDKSLINYVDGLNQQYASMLYYAKWGREILQGTVPMWDINIGMGSDIITTFHYYSLGTPLNLLLLLVPTHMVEDVYALQFIIHLYLAGAAFSFYSLSHKNSRTGTVFGAMIYCFCGFVLQKGIQHILFIPPMIFFPLILAGTDKIFRKENPGLFIFTTAFAAFYNFYFFYMIVIFLVLYVIYDYFTLCRKHSIKTAFQWIARFFLFGMVSIMISAVVFLPVLNAVLSSDRVNADNYVPFFYDLNYYYNLIFGLTANEFRAFDLRMGFNTAVLVAIFFLLTQKGYRNLKICLITLTIFLCLPFAGSALNGFGYVSNRWIFIYAMLVSYIFVKMYSDISNMNKQWIIRFSLLTGIYLTAAVLLSIPFQSGTETVFRSCLILGAVTFFIIVCIYMKHSSSAVQCILCITVLVSACLNAYYEFSPSEKSTLSAYVPENTALSSYSEQLPSNHLKEIPDIDHYRSTVWGLPLERLNSFMLQGLHGTSFYFSLIDEYTSRFFREMNYRSAMEHVIDDLDHRYILESLFAVKYYVTDESNSGISPYIFSQGNILTDTESDENITVFENKNALSLGYTYDTFLSREQYELLNVEDKQETLLYTAVPDTDLSGNMEQSDLSFLTNEELSYTISSEDNVSITENTFWVYDNDCTITFQLSELPINSEVYLIFENMDYQGIHPVDRYDSDGSGIKKWIRKTYQSAIGSWKEADAPEIKIIFGQQNTSLTYFTDKHRMYAGKHDFLCNLGYSQGETDTVTLQFPAAGQYTFDSVRIVSQPMDSVEMQLENLKQEQLRNISFNSNEIEGMIECGGDRILCIAIPYSKGWTLYVDDRKTETFSVNTMFIGAELKPGIHKIKLVYETPYLRAGVWITLAGFMFSIIIILITKKGKMRNGMYGPASI